ncbi:MAG: helix-turn-helix domain-containing protein [Roseivivax sp.]|nr:helix-turn-helix domain-containing protein [Roseivivax sp.]
METVDQLLAQMPGRLRQARRDLGLSLEAVAAQSGVSRSMVSQIERGVSSPTMATLWHLCRALRISPATLFEPGDTPTIAVTRGALRTGMAEGITPLATPPAGARTQIVLLALSPGTHQTEPAGPMGTREFLIVHEGTLTVTLEQLAKTLSIGDMAELPAHLPRQYKAGGTAVCGLLLRVTP